MGGADAGARSQRIHKLPPAHPGVRMAAFRDVMEVLRLRGKAGYPPGAPTDANLGYSVMAYQSGAILSGSRERDSHNFALIEGMCARAHPGGRNELAQLAKVRYSPRCTRPTHVGTRLDMRLGRRRNSVHGARLDMRLGRPPRQETADFRCGWNMVLGRADSTPRVFLRSVGDISRNLGIGWLNRPKSVVRSSMA